jgi:hypothetical protein
MTLREAKTGFYSPDRFDNGICHLLGDEKYFLSSMRVSCRQRYLIFKCFRQQTMTIFPPVHEEFHNRLILSGNGCRCEAIDLNLFVRLGAPNIVGRSNLLT